MLQSLSQDGEYFFLKPLGIAFFPAIFNVFVNLLWASLIFSLFGQSKWLARSSVIFFYSGQSAFWKFHRGRGVPVENEKRRGVCIREGWCWDRGKQSLVEHFPCRRYAIDHGAKCHIRVCTCVPSP